MNAPDGLAPTLPGFDVASVRAQFPVLAQRVHDDRRLAYLDNAATTQKPEAVLQALDHYYRHDNSNVHRGVHALAARATKGYEDARARIARFAGADVAGTVFTRGTTEAINLVAYSYLLPRLEAGDEILVTEMEHHANIVPWQILAERTGARVVVAPVRDDGGLDLDAWRERLTSRTRMAAFVHVSNTLGTINPVAEMVAAARERGVPTCIDGAQAVAHMPLDFGALGADFYAFSAHKLYGPTGFGVLLARPELLAGMPPWQGGGDMIETVSFDGTTFAEPPARFEAGTPHIAGAIGLAAAIDWLDATGVAAAGAHEQTLLRDAMDAIRDIPGLRVLGTAPDKAAIIAFTIDGTHPSDISSLLDMQGVAVRIGHHCTMPLHSRFGISGSARASFAVYNDGEDVTQFAAALTKAREMLR
ncbi:SufS family cysteine desulfurase [Algiphilus sp.]|uniref:SufS family cysteine desulfurase n=2 Tax=Algiphilus sp. TaxID=1872431 RepID=UPI0025C5A7C4|nr:SufS family cysteine desulfurase [Algiphilus sp.]MCK5770857.1 SufS family cysteine desulfurase [Algiphilus sp.]